MEAKKLAPLKGSWLYITISNNERKNKKNSTDGGEDAELETDKVQDHKNEDTTSKAQDQKNYDTAGIVSSSRRKISRLNSTEFMIENQNKSDDAHIQIINENVEKMRKFSMQTLTSYEEVKDQMDRGENKGEETVTGTPKISHNESWQLLDNELINNDDTMLHDIDEIIEKLKIDVVVKQVIEDKTLIQMFIPDDKIEDVLHELNYVKQIGFKPGTAVSLIPTTLNYHSYQKMSPNCLEDSKCVRDTTTRRKKMTQFQKTLKSRLIVAELIDKIEAGAEFTFDYVALLLVAAFLAFLGLIENSPVNLVASMLISPIMGPILAAIFGINIRHGNLIKIGAKREAYSLLICIAMGFFLGIIIHPNLEVYKHWTQTQKLDDLEWPTVEMSQRTQTRGLMTGVLIAMPSGVGVALSVLGGNAGSLVGVAISASLLPPAVNAGLFWAMSLCEFVISSPTFGHNGTDYSEHTIRRYRWAQLITNDTLIMDEMDHPGEILALEYFKSGWISLLLTVLNIVCIVAMGILVLWLKEVTPQKIPQRNAQLWSNVHYNKTIKRKKTNKKETDLKDFFHEMEIPEEKQVTFIQDAIEDLANDEDLINIQNLFSSNPVKNIKPHDVTFEDTEEGQRHSEIPEARFNLEERNIPRRRNGTRVRNRMSMVQKKVLNKIEKEIRVGRNLTMTDSSGLTIT